MMLQTVAGNKSLSRQNRKNKSRNKRTLKYGAGILAFVLLIVSALWLPQIFFEVSDALMYGKVSVMEQEKLDVLTLTTGYEESVYRRLASFAEGLAGQRQYYVDEQPKEVTEEIREFLFESELRYNAYGIYEDEIMGLFAESLGLSLKNYIKKAELELNRWNQYVIYSDDYAQGVNFILWCFVLKNPSGDNLTILMDAHDYTVYAVQMTGVTGQSQSKQNVNIISSYSNTSWYTDMGVWMGLNIYYEIFEQGELERYFFEIMQIRERWNKYQSASQPARIAGVLKDCAGNDVEIYLDADSYVPYGADGEGWYGEGADGISSYYSLPFQEDKMTFDIYCFETVYDASQTVISTIGIREIYELIPEFQDFG